MVERRFAGESEPIATDPILRGVDLAMDRLVRQDCFTERTLRILDDLRAEVLGIETPTEITYCESCEADRLWETEGIQPVWASPTHTCPAHARPPGDSGRTLHRLPRKWSRETPAFPTNRVEESHIPEPVGTVYQLSGEVLERILHDAGWRPADVEIGRQSND